MPPMDATDELKHSPLEKEHAALGAKLGPFGGWLMPIEYQGALTEHRAVRERVGLFDLTHLGKVEVAGPGALGLLQGVVTNDVSAVKVGRAQYNLVLNEGGGVIEDLIVYRLGPDRYFVVPNASNTQRVLQILGEANAPDRVHLMYHQDWCFLAVQGQRSPSIVTSLFPEAAELTFMRCAESAFAVKRYFPSRVVQRGAPCPASTTAAKAPFRKSPSWLECANVMSAVPSG
jgi:aminomethyltransferase